MGRRAHAPTGSATPARSAAPGSALSSAITWVLSGEMSPAIRSSNVSVHVTRQPAGPSPIALDVMRDVGGSGGGASSGE